jgi:hypothetical protein
VPKGPATDNGVVTVHLISCNIFQPSVWDNCMQPLNQKQGMQTALEQRRGRLLS